MSFESALRGGQENLVNSPSITAEKLRDILKSLNKIENNRKDGDNLQSQRFNYSSSESYEHKKVMDVINATETQCNNIFERIQERLVNLRELSQSNLALKRLIKRNRKREGEMAKRLNKYAGEADSSDSGSGSFGNERRCKLPFVVAKYAPKESDPYGGRQRKMTQAARMKLKSNRPFQVLDDLSCLENMNLELSESECDSSDINDDLVNSPRASQRGLGVCREN